MSFPTEFYLVMKRTIRIVPGFLLISLAGCVLAYIGGLRLNDIGIFVAMPLIWVLAIVCVISLFARHSDSKPPTSKLTFAAMVVIFLAFFFAGIFLLSGLSFALLKIPALAHSAYELAFGLFITSVGSILLVALIKTILVSWKWVARDFFRILFMAVVRVMSLPSQL